MRYIGTDYEADMAIIAADPETHKWWTVSAFHTNTWQASFKEVCTCGRQALMGQMTDGMQESFIPGAVGSATGPGWWTPAEEVFRMEG